MEAPADIVKDPNTLQKRAFQKEQWKTSETSKFPDTCKPASKVAFPLFIKFLNAATKSDYDDLGTMIKSGIDIDCCNFDGITALHQAVIDDNYELTQYLVEKGANVNVLDRECWTPLHVAAQSNNLEIAEFLIKHGADLSIISCDGELAFDVAEKMAMKNYLTGQMTAQRIVFEATRQKEERMMQKDATMWLTTKSYRPPFDEVTLATPLHVAAAKNYHGVMKVLLQIPQVDINARDCDGWTPLHAASHWGNHEACDLLLAHGADVLAVTLTGQSVVDTADETVLGLIEKAVKEGLVVKTTVDEVPPPPPKEVSPVEEDVSGGAKRRSSIIRKTLEEKQSLHQKAAQEEQSVLAKSGIIESCSNNNNLIVGEVEAASDVVLRESRRLRRTDSDYSEKRLSAVLAPSKSVEKEVQRHQRSRASRASRRSTQGISLEDITQAANLWSGKDEEKVNNNNNVTLSALPPAPEVVSVVTASPKQPLPSSSIASTMSPAPLAKNVAVVSPSPSTTTVVVNGTGSEMEVFNCDYKALYHKTLEEKLHLQEKYQRSLRDVELLRQKLQDHQKRHGSGGPAFEIEKSREMEHLAAENARIRDENMALVRVVTRLSDNNRV